MKLDIKKALQGLSAEKKRNIIIFLGITGIVLIFASNFIHTESKSEQNVTEENTEIQTDVLTAESYKAQLEKELEEIISSIDGAGNVKIMITMDSTAEDIYAIEKSIEERSEETANEYGGDSESDYKEDSVYVTIKNKDGSEQTVLLKQVMPKIRGVLVVCDGGGNSVTREKITQAVAGVLSISSSKVYVTN